LVSSTESPVVKSLKKVCVNPLKVEVVCTVHKEIFDNESSVKEFIRREELCSSVWYGRINPSKDIMKDQCQSNILL